MIAPHNTNKVLIDDSHFNVETTKVFIGEALLESLIEPVAPTTENCKCGKESEYGCHGMRDGKLYDEFLCKSCYNGRNE